MTLFSRLYSIAIATCLLWLGAGPGSAAPGDLRWTFPLDGPNFSSPAVDPEQPLLFVGTQGTNPDGSNFGSLVALDIGTSPPHIAWSFPVGDWIDSTPTLGANGQLYFGSWDQRLYALDASTGAELWNFETAGIIVASPAITADGRILVPSSDAFLYALNPDGSLDWQAFIGSEMDSSPAIGSDGSIYVGTYSGELVALNPDGSEQWRFPVDNLLNTDPRILASPAITPEGDIVFGSGNGRLYSLSPTGFLNWSTTFPEEMDSSPVVNELGEIHFGSRAGDYFKLDSLGVEIWSATVGDIFFSSPVLDAEGNSHIIAFDGNGQSRIYAFDPAGQSLWSHAIPSVVDASPTITPNGLLVVGGYDGNLYAFEARNPLSSLFWPKFGRDLQNRQDLNQSIPPPDVTQQFGYPTDLGNGFYGSDWLGLIYTPALPWFYRVDWDWLYHGGPGANSHLLYHPALGWLWTGPEAFPYVFEYASGEWLYLLLEQDAQPYYYRFGTNPGWFQL